MYAPLRVAIGWRVMAHKTAQIIGRGPRTWLVRVYTGRDIKKRKYLNKTIHGGPNARLGPPQQNAQ